MRRNHHLTTDEIARIQAFDMVTVSQPQSALMQSEYWQRRYDDGDGSNLLYIRSQGGLFFTPICSDPVAFFVSRTGFDALEFVVNLGDNPGTFDSMVFQAARPDGGRMGGALPNRGLNFHNFFRIGSTSRLWTNNDQSQVWQDLATAFTTDLNGRIVFPNGFTIQWGSVNATTAGVNVPFTWGAAFNVLFQTYATGTVLNQIVRVSAQTATQATVAASVAGTVRVLGLGLTTPIARPDHYVNVRARWGIE